MVNDRNPTPESGTAAEYQIRLKGHLGAEWADWFGGLAITLAPNGETLMTGRVVDQAALYGLLKKVRDLGMPLIAVMPAPMTEVPGSEPGEGSYHAPPAGG